MIKIHSLEFENVKRVHHVELQPKEDGLTVIGGKNSQGKTSILDSIAWTLGGDKFRPAGAKNDEAMTPPKLKVELSNGLIVERKGQNSSLTITDPKGMKAGQKLLDSFIEKLALDLPKFIESSDKEKAETLLQIIGVSEELVEIEQEEARLYNERLLAGRVAEAKKHHAEEMGAYFQDVPETELSPADLIKQQKELNNKLHEVKDLTSERARIDSQIIQYQEELREITRKIHALEQDSQTVKKTLEAVGEELQKMPTSDDIEERLESLEEINKKITFNKQKRIAEEEARVAEESYKDLNLQLNQMRDDKRRLLEGADLPLEDLGIEDGKLTYKGHTWNDMSSSEQLRVATAIVRRLKPECGFVLLDKLEQFDLETMEEFGSWAEAQGLQIIATRVSTGEECQIIIEDGYVKEPAKKEQNWTAGQF